MKTHTSMTGFFYTTIDGAPARKFQVNPGDVITIEDAETASDAADFDALNAVEVPVSTPIGSVVDRVAMRDSVTGEVHVVTLDNGVLNYNPEPE